MKKLLVLGVMLLSMLACSKSSSDTNDALNETAVDLTKEVVFVDDISSKTSTISNSMSKGTLSEDYTLARDTFKATAGNGHGVYVKVDGRLLDKDEIHRLANKDGFYNILEFFNWFNTDFDGQIIHWTDLKY